MICLILTERQAQTVRGRTSPGATLEPVLLADGKTWVLPIAVLDDTAHWARHAYLTALPRREVTDDEWVKPE